MALWIVSGKWLWAYLFRMFNIWGAKKKSVVSLDKVVNRGQTLMDSSFMTIIMKLLRLCLRVTPLRWSQQHHKHRGVITILHLKHAQIMSLTKHGPKQLHVFVLRKQRCRATWWNHHEFIPQTEITCFRVKSSPGWCTTVWSQTLSVAFLGEQTSLAL